MKSDQQNHGGCCHSSANETGASLVIDPVCGMKVDPASTDHHAKFEGMEYLFCSAGCRSKFIKDPPHYVNRTAAGASAASLPVPDGTIWTCPMHPQIRQMGPGNCPICGMALEPLEPSIEEGPNPELIRDQEIRDICFKPNGIIESQKREIAQMEAILERL